METVTPSEQRRAQLIDRVVRSVQLHYEKEADVNYSDATIRGHVEYLIETRGEQILEDGGELLTMMPRSEAGDELCRLLEEPFLMSLKEPETRDYQPGLFEETESIYNGFRKFAPEQVDAMILHLAFKAKNVMPTRLNKLFFYSDFRSFRKRKFSISGAEYLALKHGPMFSSYDNAIRVLERKGEVRIKHITSKGKPARIILPKRSYRPDKSILSKEELSVLDWVVEKYDHLSTDELVLQSHREDAFWESHFGQLIRYDYADSLVIEPPDSLFEN